MSEELTVTPHRLLRQTEAAEWLGLSGRTLEKHRCFGTGPAYRKIGGRVVYAMTDLVEWADRGMRHSTTDRVAHSAAPGRAPREVRTFAGGPADFPGSSSGAGVPPSRRAL